MALIGLGPIVSVTPGTKVPIVPAASTLRAMAIQFQALKITGGHANTGNVYIHGPDQNNNLIRIDTIAVPTANTIPTFGISTPGSNSIPLNQISIDADNAGDGVDIVILVL